MTGRLAHSEDAHAMTETIATAFFNDPLWSWAFADESERAQQFRVWWRVFVDAGLRNESTWVTSNCESVAIWAPPNVPELLPAEEERMVELVVEFIPGEHATAVLQVLAQFDAAHPHDTPHYYLGVVATHDDHRGHGFAEQLLAENLKQIDAEHMPAYLESSNPLNLNRYMRLGFEPTGEIVIPDGRPAVTTMWRPER
jgi:ribosomal protein S18 acetylase RimI-like enzyme